MSTPAKNALGIAVILLIWLGGCSMMNARQQQTGMVRKADTAQVIIFSVTSGLTGEIFKILEGGNY